MHLLLPFIHSCIGSAASDTRLSPIPCSLSQRNPPLVTVDKNYVVRERQYHSRASRAQRTLSRCDNCLLVLPLVCPSLLLRLTYLIVSQRAGSMVFAAWIAVRLVLPSWQKPLVVAKTAHLLPALQSLRRYFPSLIWTISILLVP